jgi:hypothetical protein
VQACQDTKTRGESAERQVFSGMQATKFSVCRWSPGFKVIPVGIGTASKDGSIQQRRAFSSDSGRKVSAVQSVGARKWLRLGCVSSLAI